MPYQAPNPFLVHAVESPIICILSVGFRFGPRRPTDGRHPFDGLQLGLADGVAFFRIGVTGFELPTGRQVTSITYIGLVCLPGGSAAIWVADRGEDGFVRCQFRRSFATAGDVPVAAGLQTDMVMS